MLTAVPMTRVRVGCDFSFVVPAPVSAVFQVEPQDEPRQRLLTHSLSFVPQGAQTSYSDTFGNRCSRLQVEPGPFTLRYDATVEVVEGELSLSSLTIAGIGAAVIDGRIVHAGDRAILSLSPVTLG